METVNDEKVAMVTLSSSVAIEGTPKLVVGEGGATVLAVEAPVLVADVPVAAVTDAAGGITEAGISIDAPIVADSIEGGAEFSVEVASAPEELEALEGFTLVGGEEALVGVNLDTNIDIEPGSNATLSLQINEDAFDPNQSYSIRRISDSVETELTPVITFEDGKAVFTFDSPGFSAFVLIAVESDLAAIATESVFSGLIATDNLVRLWRLSNAEQTWSFYDPRPAFAFANTLVTASSKDIVWIYVDSEQVFQGQTLVAGANLIALE